MIDNGCGFFWAVSTGSIGEDRGNSIAIDSSGNIYIIGFYQETVTFGTTTLTSPIGSTGLFVAKLNGQGIFQWAISPKTDAGYGHGIAVDNADNLYITGFYNGTAAFGTTTLTSKNYADIFVAKVNGQGVVQWATSVGGIGEDYSHSIAVDRLGNTYITGRYIGIAIFGNTTLLSQGGKNMFVAKLNGQGVVQWATSASGIGSDSGYDGIAVDGSGNTYITGHYTGTSTFGTTTLRSQSNNGVFVAKINNQGVFQWAISLGDASFGYGCGIAVGRSGSLYVTGLYYGTAIFGTTTLTCHSGNDIFVAKVNSQGTFQWATSMSGPGSSSWSGITVDDSENLYVMGDFKGTVTFGTTTIHSQDGTDIFVAKLNGQGIFQWATSVSGSNDSYGYGIAVDSFGNLYMTGFFRGTAAFGTTTLTSQGGRSDIFVTKLRY